MQDQVREYYERMLHKDQISPLLEETYNRAKHLSDRLDGGMFNAKELAIIAVVAGCDPFAEKNVDPPKDLDFVPTPVPDEGVQPWEKGAPVAVERHGKKAAAFVERVGDLMQCVAT